MSRVATRRAVLLAAAAAPAALASVAEAAQRSDVEVLEGLHTLELRLEGAYDAAARRGVLDEELALDLRDQEREHVRGLEQALATHGLAEPAVPRRDPRLNAALRGRAAFVGYALRLESRALRAYVDAETGLRDTRLLQPLGAIMTSEAQHTVALRQALGEPLL